MHLLRTGTIAGILLLSVVGCRQASVDYDSAYTDSQEDESALRELVGSYDAFVSSGDVDGFASLWTVDAVQVPPDEPEAQGREAIRTRFAGFVSENTDQLESTIADVSVSGDLAVVRLRFSEWWAPKTGGDTTSVVGTGVQIYERQATGAWLLATEIWNTDGPGS